METPESHVQSPFRRVLREQPEPLGDAGSVIPPELFFNILHFVKRDDRRLQTWERYQADRKRNSYDDVRDELYWELELHKAGVFYTLKSCSLVCSHWANNCRRYMFLDSTLRIHTVEHAKIFRQYATQGSLRLVKISDLVKTLEISQNLKHSRSAIDLVYMPSTRNKLSALYLAGSVAPELCSKLRTPQWSLPPVVATPYAVTSYDKVSLSDILFPSAWHVARYITYFRDASAFTFRSLHWDGKFATLLPRFANSAKRTEISVRASLCTDNLLLCLQTAMMHREFSLHSVPDRDQHWAEGIMKIVADFYDKVPPGDSRTGITYTLHGLSALSGQRSAFQFGVENTGPQHPSIVMQFICDSQLVNRTPAAGRNSPIPIRIVGIIVSIARAYNPSDFSVVDLSVLRQEIVGRCALRIVVIVFHDYAMIQALVERYPTLREALPNGQTYFFICQRTAGHQVGGFVDGGSRDSWVGIDPVTLADTGEHWDRLPDFVTTLT